MVGGSRVPVGPVHPYVTGGLAMDFPGVGYGQNDLFVWQARAFLDQVAGAGAPGVPGVADVAGAPVALPPVVSFEEGLRGGRLLRAVVEVNDRMEALTGQELDSVVERDMSGADVA